MVHFCNVLTKFPKFVTIVIVCVIPCGTKISQHCPRTQTIHGEKGKENADTEVGILI